MAYRTSREIICITDQEIKIRSSSQIKTQEEVDSSSQDCGQKWINRLLAHSTYKVSVADISKSCYRPLKPLPSGLVLEPHYSKII